MELFKPRKDYGSEYFEGDLKQMKSEIRKIIEEYIPPDVPEDPMQQLQDKVKLMEDKIDEYNNKITNLEKIVELLQDKIAEMTSNNDKLNESNLVSVNTVVHIPSHICLTEEIPEKTVKKFIKMILDKRPEWYEENKWIFLSDIKNFFIKFSNIELSLNEKVYTPLFKSMIGNKTERRKTSTIYGSAILLKPFHQLNMIVTDKK